MKLKDTKINRVRKKLLDFKSKKDEKHERYTTIYLLSMFSVIVVFSPIIVSNVFLFFSVLFISIIAWAIMVLKSIKDKKILIRIANIQNKYSSIISNKKYFKNNNNNNII